MISARFMRWAGLNLVHLINLVKIVVQDNYGGQTKEQRPSINSVGQRPTLTMKIGVSD